MKWWKTFQMPRGVEWEESTKTDRYGKFVVQPLERGYGLTLGNCLRRVALSSIQGTAVVGIKIEGVMHEFSTIPGVIEDVTEIVLNIKQLRLKMFLQESRVLHLKSTRKGEVRAKDIEPNADVQILNPDLKIATLSDGANLSMDIYLDKGRGYISADLLRDERQPIGYIPVDAIFSPVEKVNFSVEAARVEEKTDYDRLIMELWTDGSVKPEEVISHSAKVLRDHLAPFVIHEDRAEGGPLEGVDEDFAKIRELLQKPVDELELSVRSSNCLKAGKINTIGDLVQKSQTEMLKFRNFGRKSLQELETILEGMGLRFGMPVELYLYRKKKKG